MTHSELVEHARRWLVSQGCPVVITDMTSAAMETPDALGFLGPCGRHGNATILLEAKTSRSDFRADRMKSFRMSREQGMGDFRYFITPPKLLTLADLPEGWGLLEAGEKRVTRIQESSQMPKNWKSEQSVLCSAIRRIGSNPGPGFSIKAYTIETKNRATLTVATSEPL